MIDMRKDILRYLDIKQHVWNTCFKEILRSLYECEPLDSYEDIDRALFKSLICFPLGVTLSESFIVGRDPFSNLLVRPKIHSPEIVMMIRRPSSRSWEKNELYATAGLEGQYIGFFQWDNYDYHSMSQVQFRITQFPTQPHLIGGEAVASIVNVDFFGIPAGG